jgi:ribonuclease P/MRP protein subunit POP3
MLLFEMFYYSQLLPFFLRPYVPPNVQNSILAHVVSVLEGVPDYKRAKDYENRKRKSSVRKHGLASNSRKRRKLDRNAPDEDLESGSLGCETAGVVGSDLSKDVIPKLDSSMEIAPAPPAALQHFTIGINEVTKRLESQVQASRTMAKISSNTDLQTPSTKINTVLVCRADVDPPLLIAHIPHLVAAYNSSVSTLPQPSQSLAPIKLVSLPKGSELVLAEALGLRRVAVIAIDVCPANLLLFLLLDIVNLGCLELHT